MGNKTTGATLRSLRERSDFSVKEVVELLKQYDFHISDKTLYSYESGKRAMSGDMLLTLCRIYKCNNILETFGDVETDYEIPDDYEWSIIKKYRTIDAYGKEAVDSLLNIEYERCAELKTQRPDINKQQYAVSELNAAHERTDIKITDEMKRHDDDIMDDDDF